LQTTLSIGILDLDSIYSPFSGSFVLFNLNAGNSYLVYNDSLSSKRFSPCSTFKITNSLIGIESGVAENENYLIEYDSTKISPKPWWYATEPFKYWMQDHTMKSAIKYSVVWYYQELARRIGGEKMKDLLNRIDYGNNDISSGIDKFWLCGSLRISAAEQVEFLKKLYSDKLPGFSVKTQEIVKNIMLYESTDKYKLYGKTGGGDCWDNKVIGWYVGFIETESNTYIFGMNVFADNFSDLNNNKRIEMTKDILKKLEIIE
jgi:beta-lactamase class D